MEVHEKYMQRCLELAQNGLGSVKTNPLVGAVIVYDQQIIGEGYHQKYGEAHAEVHAIEQVFHRFPEDAAHKLKNSTLYVSLEPCAHIGKTPPCATLIVKHQIPKVVIANLDPFDQVNGNGIKLLKAAGIEVLVGVLAAQAKQVNKRFFCHVLKNRPYIILKWAETNNGFFAPNEAKQVWISSALAKSKVHQWRAQEMAVMVGFQTALIDNPQLNVREATGENPIRIVLDRHLQLPSSHHLLDSTQKTFIFNASKSEVIGQNHFLEVPEYDYYVYQKIMYQLYMNDVSSVLIEGGKKTLSALIDIGLWDEARVFTAKNVSWEAGLEAPIVSNYDSKTIQDLGADFLTLYTNKNAF